MRCLVSIAVCILCIGLIFPPLSVAKVLVINNPEIPPVQTKIEMKEIWRLGDNENEEFIFGVISSVFRDGAGNFYLLDSQQAEVFKFSPEGIYLNSVSRKGQGPGEISLCYFCGMWDKSRIGCLNISPKRIVLFDKEGIPKGSEKATPLDDLGSEETISISSFTRRDGFTVAYGRHYFFEDGESSQVSFLSTFDDQMDELFRYKQQPTGYNFRKPIVVNEEADFIAHRRWALGLGGEIFLVPDRTGFLIEVRDSEGNILRKILRQWTSTKRTKAEMKDAKNQYQFSTNGPNMPDISYKISDFPTSIQKIQWMENHLWVQTSNTEKKTKAGQGFVVDVFNQEGHLLEERTYNVPFDDTNDEIHWLSQDQAIVVKNIHSAVLAAQGSEWTVQVGEGKEEFSDEEDSTLEVILYQIKTD